MQPQKPLNSVTDEELLQALNRPEDKESLSYTNDVEHFLAVCNLSAGNELIKSTVLYKIYNKWSKNPVKAADFTKKVTEFIPIEDYDTVKYYRINKIPLNLKADSIKYLDNEGRKIKSHVKLVKHKKHVDKFLKEYTIEPGKFYIENFILYYLYDKWTYKNQHKQPFSLITLTKYLDLYFHSKNRTKGEKTTWFGVNKSILKHITYEEMDQIREGRKRFPRDKKTKKETNTAKQNTVSEPTTQS